MKNSKFCFLESQDTIAHSDYPTACTGITITKDHSRLITLGIYKPSIKVFDLENATLKFERHLIADGIKALALTEDGEKFAVLRKCRSIEFHSRNGLHETIKLPYQPKDIEFNNCKSEVYMCGNYDSVYRFNLEQGRFLKGININKTKKVIFSEINGLLLGITDDSVIFVDTRSNEKVIIKKIERSNQCVDITEFKYAIASESGHVCEFDMRMNEIVKESKMPIGVTKVKYCEDELFVASGDKIMNFACDLSVIEMDYEINDFDVCKNFLFIGGENKEIMFLKNEQKNK